MASAVRPGDLLAIIGAGAVAALALWWHSTLAISGLGGWLTGAGEILGLLAGYGVVVLVLLMARVTPIERGGAGRLARWVAGIRHEAPRTVSIYVKGRRLRELQAEPGQFFRFRRTVRGGSFACLGSGRHRLHDDGAARWGAGRHGERREHRVRSGAGSTGGKGEQDRQGLDP